MKWNYFKQFCKPGFNSPLKSVAQVLRDEDCPSMIIPSRPCIWHCYWEYDHLKRIPGSDLTVYDTGFQRDFRVCLQLRQTWLAFRALLAAGYWVLLGTFLSPHTPPRPHHLPPSGKSAHRHPQQAPSSCHQLPPGPHRAALGGHHHPPVLGGPGAGLPFRRQGTCAWP
ncbi:choline transporter-like protein 5 isoform X2 [Strigops habroptila]|uniref:choline transporter-like protein 5 isoform X2 n=1 Tax=Strigops habroptila TaxID=2489341 RepID=UPI0011CF86C2|nr:choline transporter-like protein 5 isoform X2 [Strigops habroptila]